jgi:hypothetical protein
MSEAEFRSPLSEIVRGLKEDSNKEIKLGN